MHEVCGYVLGCANWRTLLLHFRLLALLSRVGLSFFNESGVYMEEGKAWSWTLLKCVCGTAPGDGVMLSSCSWLSSSILANSVGLIFFSPFVEALSALG